MTYFPYPALVKIQYQWRHLLLFALNLYNKKKITWWLEVMNFIFSWWKQYFTHSLCWFVKYCFHHLKIKSIWRYCKKSISFEDKIHCVIFSVYILLWKHSNWPITLCVIQKKTYLKKDIRNSKNGLPCLQLVHVYSQWCKHKREFDRIWKFMWTRASRFTYKYFQIGPNSLECLHQVIHQHRASIFFFFYKIRLGNMLWHTVTTMFV